MSQKSRRRSVRKTKRQQQKKKYRKKEMKLSGSTKSISSFTEFSRRKRILIMA